MDMTGWDWTQLASGIVLFAAVITSLGMIWQKLLGPFIAKPIANKVSHLIQEEVAELVDARLVPVNAKIELVNTGINALTTNLHDFKNQIRNEQHELFRLMAIGSMMRSSDETESAIDDAIVEAALKRGVQFRRPPSPSSNPEHLPSSLPHPTFDVPSPTRRRTDNNGGDNRG